jgi:phosphatidylserine/phosphatidylglycerophosphate/cardiolipin synthase-like enzyme
MISKKTFVIIGIFLALVLIGSLFLYEKTFPTNAPISVFFSPNGGCTTAIIEEINNAKSEILVQAYSFTSAPIAKSLVDAHKKGIKVLVILDKSQKLLNIRQLVSCQILKYLLLLMILMQ